MTKLYYKFLDQNAAGEIVSRHGDQAWTVGEEYSVEGEVLACSNGFHASEDPLDALGYVSGGVLALVEAGGSSDNGVGKVCFRSMRIVRAYRWTKEDSVALAVFAAELVLHLFEEARPGDDRPRKAIAAAKSYLAGRSSNAAYAADAAAAAGYAAGYADAAAAAAAAAGYAADAAAAAAAGYDAAYAAAAGYAAGYDAAYAAAAGYAAAYAADAAAAADAGYAAAYAADAAAAADAAYAAADADGGIRRSVNEWIKSRVSQLDEL